MGSVWKKSKAMSISAVFLTKALSLLEILENLCVGFRLHGCRGLLTVVHWPRTMLRLAQTVCRIFRMSLTTSRRLTPHAPTHRMRRCRRPHNLLLIAALGYGWKEIVRVMRGWLDRWLIDETVNLSALDWIYFSNNGWQYLQFESEVSWRTTTCYWRI